ncbi:MAG TPA: hypothetical protein VN901_25885 [Candidatus Acidoferrales bacterium]|nr:hypothetical protein [Candidatus Acidoferrales bacterium]
MKTISKMLGAALGFVLMGALLTAMAAAQCGTPTAKLHKQAWRVGDPTAPLTQAADTVEPIVGMWHVMFTAEGNGEGPPNGTPIDNALIVWHSDGTEIMTSMRPAQDGDICLGVWKKVGPNKYKVNHLPWFGNDTTNAPSGIGNPAGPTRIIEAVTVSADGSSLSGSFSLRATDTTGKTTAFILGTITGTRVTTETTIRELL